VVSPVPMFFNPLFGLSIHRKDVSQPIAFERDMSRGVIQVYGQQTVLSHFKRFKTQDNDLMLGSNADCTRCLCSTAEPR
jgi:hypothetical protein